MLVKGAWHAIRNDADTTPTMARPGMFRVMLLSAPRDSIVLLQIVPEEGLESIVGNHSAPIWCT